jgi:hypothetical protein
MLSSSSTTSKIVPSWQCHLALPGHATVSSYTRMQADVKLLSSTTNLRWKTERFVAASCSLGCVVMPAGRWAAGHCAEQGPQAAGRTATAAQSSADAALHMQSGQSPHCDGNCGILGPVTGAATSDPCTLHHEGLPHGYVATGSLSSPYALPGSPSASWSEDHNATGPMQQVSQLHVVLCVCLCVCVC